MSRRWRKGVDKADLAQQCCLWPFSVWAVRPYDL